VHGFQKTLPETKGHPDLSVLSSMDIMPVVIMVSYVQKCVVSLYDHVLSVVCEQDMFCTTGTIDLRLCPTYH
jgi:hypothetical protein